ncbi:hypothetical protein MMC26_007264 [Xylographa opegraphella]|nr:hypothetical protein [Xylographa opegraphella]
MDSENIAEQLSLSEGFEAGVGGPLVGPKEPITSVLKTLATTSDTVYRMKRQWILSNYFVYRYIIGDGNCGWRAIIFALFEVLLRSGSHANCLDQITRMKDLETSLKNDFDNEEFIYEDWRDATLDLLQWVADSIPCTDDTVALTQKFNDPETAGQVIQWFRMIAGAWLLKHADLYKGFMGDVSEYKSRHIDPHVAEIEEFGIKILFDAVIEPAGIDVEIVYVDRSETNGIANIHRYEPQLPSGEPKPGYRDTIRLLYSIPQGAHYDLLYKEQDFLENPRVLRSDDKENYIEDELLQREPMLAKARFGKSHGPGNRLQDPQFSFPGNLEYPTATADYTGIFDTHEGFDEDFLFSNEYVNITSPDALLQPMETTFEAPIVRQSEQIWRSRVDQRSADDPIRTHMLGYIARDSHVPAPPAPQQFSGSSTHARIPKAVETAIVEHKFIHEDPGRQGRKTAKVEVKPPSEDIS